MIDKIRQAHLNGQMDEEMSYKDALIEWHLGQTIPVGIIKDEIGDIVGSSWATDFNERFPHLVEAYYILSGYSLPDQPDWSTDEH